MTGGGASGSKVLMVQGASSSAGKSLLVTALCHSFSRRGMRVTPFKAQNMSNNAAVCPDGSEIGRAQYVQALAAGVVPGVEINPVLIKPEADARAQVVIMGKPFATLEAGEYFDYKQELWKHITVALDHLRAQYDLVVIEGAGSPAELNLKSGDIVNMAVAGYAKSPVLLVGDIDRGGIFAQLIGTLWLLDAEERALVRGLVVNKFRGDLSLFQDGVRILEEKSSVPVLGVIPYMKDLHLPEEDAVALETQPSTGRSSSIEDRETEVDIAILRLPLISNFDDFDPFGADPGVRIRYINSPGELGRPDAVIIPGTKSTVADLAWLRERGLDQALIEHVRGGGALVGVCGGYQMLGQVIRDPRRVESQVEITYGLGLLPVETIFLGEKTTTQVRARVRSQHYPAAVPHWLEIIQEQEIDGYEIHMGETSSASTWLEIVSRNGDPVAVMDGAINPDGRVWGCYLHGVFANQDLRHAWLSSLGWGSGAACFEALPSERLSPVVPGSGNSLAQVISRLTDTVEAALDMPRLEEIIWEN
jgi:adenosylcobyric acid synthase